MTFLSTVPSPRDAEPDPIISSALWPITAGVDELGRLCVGGVPLVDIADTSGTPAYVIDETDFRHRIRCYRRALPNAEIVYAGKALLTTSLARWVAEEHIGLDVCSSGELAVAIAGGMDPARIVVHGNAKSSHDLREAVSAGVGRIVIDSITEIERLAKITRRPQAVHIRVTPGIDIHGHAAVTTGITDQKFGFPLAGGTLTEAVTRILAHPALRLTGLHCHIGSQVTDPALYGETIRRMIAAMVGIRHHHGVTLAEVNIGGGHAVRYIDTDTELSPAELAPVIDEALDYACAAHHFPHPRLIIEPGRALAPAPG